MITNMRVRIVILALLPVFLCSCSHDKQSASSERWVKTDEVKPQPTRQSTLTNEQLVRIRKIQTSLAEVDNSSLGKWIQDFEKDRNPEKDIRVWEFIQAAYKMYCSTHVLAAEAKKEVVGILLLRSATSNQTEILRRANLKKLTRKQAQDVMAE